MAYLTVPNVQAWLANKYKVANVDAEMEQSAINTCISYTSKRYDTTTWVDLGTTPELILNVMSMLVAAWTLQKFGSDDNPNPMGYPAELEERALKLLMDIQNGSVDLSDATELDANTLGQQSALFYPTDEASETGTTPGYAAYQQQSLFEDNAAPMSFGMGLKF